MTLSEWCREHPERGELLLAQWSSAKNDLGPDEVSAGSHKKYWWKCEQGRDHEWAAALSSRTGSGKGCFYCSGHRVSVTNSLATLYPEVAKQWHPTKNGDLTPDKVVAGTGRKVWWTCDKGPDHEWEAAVRSRARGSGCPCCRGLRVSVTNSLATLYAEVAKQWHPTRNGDLEPEAVVAGSNKKYWWKCAQGTDHEWQAPPGARTGDRPTGCPSCSGYRVSVTNSLATLYPEVAKQWHPTRNGDLEPEAVVAGSATKYWWKCAQGLDHEWQATVVSRSTGGRGCPFCNNDRVSVTNSLATRYPEFAKQWHPTKNGDLSPDDVVAGSQKRVWWKCDKGPDHEWETQLASRANKGSGCPCCDGKRVSVTNSLATLHPEVAKEWHPTKNTDLTPDMVVAGSNKKVWWECEESPDHDWEASVKSRSRGSGCPSCAGQRVSVTNSLAALYPDIAEQWHPVKNGDLTPETTVAGSGKKVWWKCDKGPDHEWQAVPADRIKGVGCPGCSSYQLSVTNSLATLYPEIAKQWHWARNGDLTPETVVAGSKKKVWWKCERGPHHQWEASVQSRTRGGTGCPSCVGWTQASLRRFVEALGPHLGTMTQAELWVLLQQNGMLGSTRAKFARRLAAGAVGEELDVLLEQVLGAVVDEDGQEGPDEDIELNDLGEAVEEETRLPEVTAHETLDFADSGFWASCDDEAVEFLVAAGVSRLWAHAYGDLSAALEQTAAQRAGEYAERIRTEFRTGYAAAASIELPHGYTFQIDGEDIVPNLMQRNVAAQIRDRRRLGNWSGTGAGKTLSAVLASRLIDAELTIVCCPNAVVAGWRETILNAFPNAQVETKTLAPAWTGSGPRYLVLNYETFQQNWSESRLATLVESNRIDMIVIDEIHYAKQRTEEASQRRRLVQGLIAAASENDDLAVLGMSATPVINNLHEARSMIELITGVEHDDLEVRPTVANAMKIHQHLVRLGPRWMPAYDTLCETIQHDIELEDDIVDDLKALGRTPHAQQVEAVLTGVRAPEFVKVLEDARDRGDDLRTVVYTHYVEGIVQPLKEAFEEAGFRVGLYTGSEKSGLARFLAGNIDVLIASSTIGTGVDGLQHVCRRLMINALPWTAAEYEQLVGRLIRLGGTAERVEVIQPVTRWTSDGEEWSWCRSRLERIRWKRSLADAAVDGVVPEGQTISPQKATEAILGWLHRLEQDGEHVVHRQPIAVQLDPTPPVAQDRLRRFGEFSTMNARWNSSRSDATHQRLNDDPEEWFHYHSLYRAARTSWDVVPFERIAAQLLEMRAGKIVGDLGCGEALLSKRLAGHHTVLSFDHVAADEAVTVADLASLPIDDGTCDIVVLSLALMGANWTTYLAEAARVLDNRGLLFIAETDAKAEDRAEFEGALVSVGFAVVRYEKDGAFWFVEACRVN